MKFRLFLLSTCLAAAPAFAQLVPPGAAGTAMDHLHLNAKDVDAARSVFLALGGVAYQNGPIAVIQFPGVYVAFTKAESKGGSIGSNVNHVTFLVKNMAESLAKWKTAGLPIEAGTRASQNFINTADGLRVEILEDTTIAAPIQFNHVHFMNPAAGDVEAWYVKTFGATPTKRGQFDDADIPGGTLRFGKSEMAQIPTKGRVFDHIGFHIRNLEAFCKKLEAQGQKFDTPYRQIPNSKIAIAFITDPWGTAIELVGDVQ